MRIPSIRGLASIASVTVTFGGAWFAPAVQADWVRDGVPLVNETHTQQMGAFVYSLASGAIGVWGDARFGNYDIYAQRMDSSGVIQWSLNGVSVCSAATDQIRPAAEPSGDGGAVVFWQDRRSSGTTGYDIYAQRIDPNGVSQWTMNGIPLGTRTGDDTLPLVISDGNVSGPSPPGWVALWSDPNENGFHMQHVDWYGGAMWTTPSAGGVPLASSASIRFTRPVMVTDGVGGLTSPNGAVVAWEQVLTGSPTGSDVYARRIDGSGTPQWTPGGVALCALAGDQTNAAISNVSAGTVIIAWDDRRIADRDIYAQKLNSSGTAQWVGNGLAVCQSTGEQRLPRTMPDGTGGVFVVWEDARSGIFKLYGQRVSNGEPVWAPDGIALCSGSGQQSNAEIISDLTGGMIVVWTDYRGSNANIYAQRVDSNGNLQWPAEGVPLTFATGTQDNVAVVSDNNSGVLAAWADLRAGNFDIYMNRAFAGGGVLDVAPAVPQRFRLAHTSSNPARGEVRLRLELPEAANVSAEVLDAAGRRVRTLRSSTRLGAGMHPIAWDGIDDAGAPVAAGVYFVRVRADAASLVTRVVELR